MKTRIMLVGGFLGAGKTTLLWEAASRLVGRGQKVALITNDQASELVDSALLLQTGLTVAEVSGSCFCCNFHGFADSIAKVRAGAPDVQTSPKALDRIIRAAFGAAGIPFSTTERVWHFLRPGRPAPTYRFAEIV